MQLLVVLPVCEKDFDLAILNLEIARKLDGRLQFDCMVSHEKHFESRQVIKEAKKTFANVFTHVYDDWIGNKNWPTPQNYAWQTAARHIENNSKLNDSFTGWFWWEADAVPIRPGWLKELDNLHKKSKKPFSGHLVEIETNNGIESYMNGVGIWPTRISQKLSRPEAMWVQNFPFDRVAAIRDSYKFNKINSTIQHIRKVYGGRNGASFDKEKLNRWKEMFPDASIVHGISDASLHNLVLGRNQLPTLDDIPYMGRSKFYHSGDLGDIVYSLLTVKELGGGEMLLGPDNKTNMSTRTKMNPKIAGNIAPLLESQAYIHKVNYSEKVPENCNYDLNQMRRLLRTHRIDMQSGFNLARCYLQAFGLGLHNDNSSTPWLTVPEPKKVTPIVIHRSPRYQDPFFKWNLILEQYGKEAVFIGTEEEWREFYKQVGKINYFPTKNVLEMAQVIAGADLFIGNQSLGYAIAEGLKKTAILEKCPNGSNTIFNRPNVIHDFSDISQLPKIESGLKPVPFPRNQEIVLRGHADEFTGIGRMNSLLARSLSKSGVKTNFIPISRNERIPIHTETEKILTLSDDQKPGLLFCSFEFITKNIRSGDVVFTMWESTAPDANVINCLNQMASLVIVPSQWNASVFSASGLETPISIVNLGIDDAVFRPKNCSKKIFRFGTAGRTAHGASRKGIESVIEAFQKAFPKNRKFELSLKLFGDCPIPKVEDERIEILTKDFEEQELVDWYNSLSCYVNASKGEGWGLHVHEAMACRIPVITPNHSALSEFVTNSNASVIGHEIVRCKEHGYKGHWFEPIIEEIISAMRKPGLDSDKSNRSKVNKAFHQANLLSGKSMAGNVIKILKGHGALK